MPRHTAQPEVFTDGDCLFRVSQCRAPLGPLDPAGSSFSSFSSPDYDALREGPFAQENTNQQGTMIPALAARHQHRPPPAAIQEQLPVYEEEEGEGEEEGEEEERQLLVYGEEADRKYGVRVRDSAIGSRRADHSSRHHRYHHQSAPLALSRGARRQAAKRKRVISFDQRKAANIRERRRMVSLNDAFETLRHALPTFSYEKKLSRIETLRLALTYMAFMTDVLHGANPRHVRLLPAHPPCVAAYRRATPPEGAAAGGGDGGTRVEVAAGAGPGPADDSNPYMYYG